jgi:phage tail sheath protein FI
MPTYMHPGVYIEEIPSGLIPVEAASTSTTVFLGYLSRGTVGEPELIFKQDDFVQKFGKINDQYGGLRDTGKDKLGDAMGHSIAAFFLNGGRQAYIVRLARDGTPALVAASTGITNPADPAEIFEFTAVNEGSWGNDLVVRMELVDASDPALGYLVQVGHGEGDDFEALEAFSQISLVSTDPRYLVEVINDGSILVEVADGKAAADLSYTRRGSLTSDSLAAIDSADFETLAGKTLTLEFDGGPATTSIAFPGASAADKKTSLASVAEFIQSEVRKTAGTAPHPAINFTAELIDNRLILTSGTESDGTSSSSVAATGSSSPTSARAILGLGASAVADSVTSTADLPYAAGEDAKLSAGSDGEQPQLADYQAALTKLENYRDASIICVPGRQWDPDASSDLIGKSVIEAAVAHAEKMRNRMVVVDPEASIELKTQKAVKDQGFTTSSYSALYYPYVWVANPYYHPENAPNRPKTVLVPPSGFAAGVWSRIDGRRGVWKAPAGLEADVKGIRDTEFVVGDPEQDQLNIWGVNAIRGIVGPPVVWGSRTLATKANPEYRYVPVRRTAIMIGESLYQSLQSVVFQPNNHVLWGSLRANIGGFMEGLFRAGAFQGEKSSDAYFVRCNLGDTMTQADIDSGIVRVIVGFAPLKPAEFVIIQIQQKLNQQ